MSNQPPLSVLQADLLRQGLPAWYVRRVVEELEQHQQDIAAEPGTAGHSPTARLGDLQQLAERIVREFRASRFVGRHPVLSFVLFPIPLAILTWCMVTLGWALGLHLLVARFDLEGNATRWNSMIYLLQLVTRFVPFTLAALLLSRAAYRAGRGGWALIACVLVSLLAGSLVVTYRFKTGEQDGLLFCSPLFLRGPVPWSLHWQHVSALKQLLQLAVPLAVWLYFAAKFEYRRRRAVRAANLTVAG
jgi:hypothetical protein